MSATRYDVAVVGGGSAGFAAAIAAAGCGARTLLIERADSLGGNVSQALVHTLCGLYEPADDGPSRPAHPGLPRRFADALRQAGAAGEPERVGRVWVLPTDPPAVSACAAAWCEAAAGLELQLKSEVVAARLVREGVGSQLLRVRRADGAESDAIAAVVVDTSGDAAAAALAGADVARAPGSELQIPSFIFRLAGVETAALAELAGFGRLRITRAVAAASRAGELPPGCEALLLRPAVGSDGVYVTLNVPRPAGRVYDPLDRDCLESLTAFARDAAERVVDHLRATRPAFARCRVDRWPARLGVRETRRLRGESVVATADVRAGRRRDDEVARSTWPIELWRDHRKADFEYPEGPASIPLGALVSRSHPRLAAAGRCLSADSDALGALRVLGTALASGEAAGVVAALAADAGTPLAAVAPRAVRDHIERRA